MSFIGCYEFLPDFKFSFSQFVSDWKQFGFGSSSKFERSTSSSVLPGFGGSLALCKTQAGKKFSLPNNGKKYWYKRGRTYVFKEGVLLLIFQNRSEIAMPCTQGFWTKGLDKIITSLNGASDAKYHQRALKSVLVHKPELLG